MFPNIIAFYGEVVLSQKLIMRFVKVCNLENQLADKKTISRGSDFQQIVEIQSAGFGV